MTDEQKELIDDCSVSEIIEAVGMDDILDEITPMDIAFHYDLDEILDEYSSKDDIANYLDRCNFDFSEYAELEEKSVDNLSDVDLLLEFCKRSTMRGFLTREDMRDIINNYIDNMIYRCYNL